MKVIDPTKDETFILLRGKVKVSSLNDDGSIRDKRKHPLKYTL